MLLIQMRVHITSHNQSRSVLRHFRAKGKATHGKEAILENYGKSVLCKKFVLLIQ